MRKDEFIMKFQDMPYERIDFAKVQEEMGELIRSWVQRRAGKSSSRCIRSTMR